MKWIILMLVIVFLFGCTSETTIPNTDTITEIETPRINVNETGIEFHLSNHCLNEFGYESDYHEGCCGTKDNSGGQYSYYCDDKKVNFIDRNGNLRKLTLQNVELVTKIDRCEPNEVYIDENSGEEIKIGEHCYQNVTAYYLNFTLDGKKQNKKFDVSTNTKMDGFDISINSCRKPFYIPRYDPDIPICNITLYGIKIVNEKIFEKDSINFILADQTGGEHGCYGEPCCDELQCDGFIIEFIDSNNNYRNITMPYISDLREYKKNLGRLQL